MSKKENTTRSNKKKQSFIKKWWFWLIIIIIVGGGTYYWFSTKEVPKNDALSKQSSTDSSNVIKNEIKKNNPKPQKAMLGLMNDFAEESKNSEPISISGDVKVGKDDAVTPGIYDLDILDGEGNILGDRKDGNPLLINWAGAANGISQPSKIRIILFEGDVLQFSDISQVKFTAVPKDVSPSNEIGVGEFIVGRDIAPGKYTLSTNMQMDPDFDTLGWDIQTLDIENSKIENLRLSPANSDVSVDLKDGQIISTSYYNSNNGENANDARLIFNNSN